MQLNYLFISYHTMQDVTLYLISITGRMIIKLLHES
jgi:hypothetical protein